MSGSGWSTGAEWLAFAALVPRDRFAGWFGAGAVKADHLTKTGCVKWLARLGALPNLAATDLGPLVLDDLTDDGLAEYALAGSVLAPHVTVPAIACVRSITVAMELQQRGALTDKMRQEAASWALAPVLPVVPVGANDWMNSPPKPLVDLGRAATPAVAHLPPRAAPAAAAHASGAAAAPIRYPRFAAQEPERPWEMYPGLSDFYNRFNRGSSRERTEERVEHGYWRNKHLRRLQQEYLGL